jgi:hypothetical protein
MIVEAFLYVTFIPNAEQYSDYNHEDIYLSIQYYFSLNIQYDDVIL